MKAQLRTKPKMTPKKDPVHDRDESQNDVPVDRSVLQGKSKYHTLEASRVNSRTISLKSLLATMSMDPAAMFLHLWMPSYCRQPSARGKQHSCPLRRVRVALNARRCEWWLDDTLRGLCIDQGSQAGGELANTLTRYTTERPLILHRVACLVLKWTQGACLWLAAGQWQHAILYHTLWYYCARDKVNR